MASTATQDDYWAPGARAAGTGTDMDTATVAPSKNGNLAQAKRAKNDEFYTQWVDIEREMNAYIEYDPDVFRGKTILLPCDDPGWSNFTKFFALHFVDLGIAKLISTSYAPASKPDGTVTPPSELETSSPHFDPELSRTRGKVFTLLPEDITGDGRIDFDDLRWEYLEGDGDFRSEEVTALRDEADIVITNPPFSLFREFVAWLMEADIKFSIIGNRNAITYKEVFPLIQQDRMWLGRGFTNGDAYFRIPESASSDYASGVYDPETSLVHFRNAVWFTSIEHGRRHEPLQLMTMADNRRFSRHVKIRDFGYPEYDNYDAIEVARVDAIPSDYDGVMGVPITFLDKYNPAQFEIVGVTESNDPANARRTRWYSSQECRDAYLARFGKAGVYDLNASACVSGVKVFKRILIRHRDPASTS